ncbi:MAG TPA: hypothetical protein DIV40_01020 [Clostridiales bacterium]|nr:hypothetical protein [Clostridiales bacterium]
MKKKLNNKGSTMIMLVMAISIISVLGVAILGVTLMNYKIKKANTDMKYSFYMSESGLDRAYAAAYAVILNSIEEANESAQAKIEEFDHDKLMDILLNGTEDDIDKYLEDDDGDGVFDFRQSVIDEEAKEAFEEKYIDKIEDDIETAIIDAGYGDSDDDDEILTISLSSPDYGEFSISRPLRIPVSSEYENKITDTVKKTNVDIVIGVPDYNKSYTVSTVTMEVNPYWTKAITANNLNINNDDTSFNGEVFVNNDTNIGIGVNAKFGKDLSVKRHINIDKNGVLETKNVYTNGIFLEGEGAKFTAVKEEDSSVLYSGVMVKDDLELNAEGQVVKINGPYYGFATSQRREDFENSAIIINNENVELEITGDLFLYGTSYIKDIPTKYATGESLSVKGNYIAYTVGLNSNDVSVLNEEDRDDFVESNIIFDYDRYTPLPRLAEKFNDDNSEIAVYDKAKYIKAYSKNYSSSLFLGAGAIKLSGAEKALHGTAVSNGSIITSDIPLNNMISKSSDMQDVYDIKINKLGFDTEGVSEFTTKEIFDNIKGLSSAELAGLYNKINSATGQLVHINNNPGGVYTFPSGVKSGLVITNENIVISGEVVFTGVIICDGDITIKNDPVNPGSKTFKYNKGVITTLIAEHNLYELIFEDTQGTGELTSITTFKSGEDGVNVNFSELLRFENWKIK